MRRLHGGRIARLFLMAILSWQCIAPVAAATGDACVDEAARRFLVPASLIAAVMDVEGGRVGAVSHNANGSFDIGPMQINSIWLPQVEKRGGSLELLLHHRCANIHFGAWLLSRELRGIDPERIDVATFWRAVANYHSRTPSLNERYAARVWRAWMRRNQQTALRLAAN